MLPDKPNYLRARCPSTFSSITIELNLKNDRKIYLSTDSQRTVCSIYLSLLRFSSIAIELKVDGQRALIFKQYLNEFINKEMADVVHEFIDHPSYLTLTFRHHHKIHLYVHGEHVFAVLHAWSTETSPTLYIP